MYLLQFCSFKIRFQEIFHNLYFFDHNHISSLIHQISSLCLYIFRGIISVILIGFINFVQLFSVINQYYKNFIFNDHKLYTI